MSIFSSFGAKRLSLNEVDHFSQLGRLQEAWDDINSALAREENLVEAYWHRHMLFLVQGKPYNALEDLGSILKINKSHSGAFRSRFVDLIILLSPIKFHVAMPNFEFGQSCHCGRRYVINAWTVPRQKLEIPRKIFCPEIEKSYAYFRQGEGIFKCCIAIILQKEQVRFLID